MEPDVLHYIIQRGQDRASKITRAKTPAFKRRRMQKDFDNLKANTEIARRERATRDGTYQTGIGMDGGYTEEDLLLAAGAGNQAKKCGRCGRVGHRTANSRACPHYKQRGPPKKKTTADEVTARDAEELSRLDSMPFDTVLPDASIDSDDEEFFDALGGDVDFGTADDHDDIGIVKGNI